MEEVIQPTQESNTPPSINPSLVSAENNASSSFFKRKIFIIPILLVLLISTLIFMFFFFSRKPSAIPSKPIENKNSTVNTKPITVPKFKAETYNFLGNIPPKKGLNSYTIPLFTQNDAKLISEKLGLTQYNTDSPDGYYEYVNQNEGVSGVADFNATSGTFLYQSYGTFIPGSFKQGQSPTVTALELIKDLGIYDDTISCGITYTDINSPGVTYVECHRDWDTLSAPLLNLGGVLNLPENILISSLKPGEVNSQISLPNPDIQNVSNGGNGFARPNDFNTITIGLYSNGALSSIDSTMRKIDVKNSINLTDILTPEEALREFAGNNGEFTLTIPAGSGSVDYGKVYPDNTANAKIAEVYEITPAYLDKPFNAKQTAYEPYYLIQGSALLNSGYTVRFTQAIPAQKSKLISSSQKISEGTGIQLNTFQVAPKTPTITIKTTTTPSGLPTVTPQPPCKLITNENLRIGGLLEVPGYGTVRLMYNGEFGARTYSFGMPALQPSSAMVNAIENAYHKTIGKALAIYQAKTSQNVQPELYGKKRTICSALITDNCFNQAGLTIALNTRAETLTTYSTDQLKAMAYPIPIDVILVPTVGYTGSPPGQVLTWLFSKNYGASSRSNSTGGNGTLPKACYISGNSPHIFISSKKVQHVQIKSSAYLTYSDPYASGNIWSGTVENNKFNDTTGIARSSIYYEYDPKNVNFNEAKKGYISTRSNISEVVSEIANKLELTKTETQALYSDVQKVLVDLPKSHFIKISIIDENEINKKLPLEISPNPESITRFHLMVSVANLNEKTDAPILEKVKRSDYSVLELGTYAKK